MPLEVMERVYSGHWLLQSFNCQGFVHDFYRFTGKKFFTKYCSLMHGGINLMIWDTEEFEKSASYLTERFINDEKWRKELNNLFESYSHAYFYAGERLRTLPFSSLSNLDIIKEVRMIVSLQKYHQILGVILTGFPIDGKNHLSNKLMSELPIYNHQKFSEYWSLLTIPTKLSLRQLKDRELAHLASQKNVTGRFTREKLAKIHEKYCWIDYLYHGPPASIEQYEKELQKADASNKLDIEFTNTKKKQISAMNAFHFNKKHRDLIALAQQIIWQKGWRKDYQAHGFWCYEPLIREIARRNRCDNWQILMFLFPWELEGFIRYKKPSVEELQERKKFSLFMSTEISNTLYTGLRAREIVAKLNLNKHIINQQELKGQCAYAGYAKGRAKIIMLTKEMGKMNKGDILISQATSPDLMPAMTKAAAIVTNTGGLICHAAITARELKIPCIVGTHNATFIFKDGDMVEVDATKGVIRKL